MKKRFWQVLVVVSLVMVAQSAMAFGFCPLGKKSSSRPHMLPIVVQQAPVYMLTPQGMLVPVYPQQLRMPRRGMPVWRRPPAAPRLGYR